MKKKELLEKIDELQKEINRLTDRLTEDQNQFIADAREEQELIFKLKENWNDNNLVAYLTYSTVYATANRNFNDFKTTFLENPEKIFTLYFMDEKELHPICTRDSFGFVKELVGFRSYIKRGVEKNER